VHTTNYVTTFLEVAEDCRVAAGTEPPERAGGKSAARMQYERIAGSPYRYTSDEVLFQVHAERSGIPEAETEAERQRFFSKGQPCMRASDLTKRYGWGIHFDGEGRMALYGVESPEYRRLANDPALAHVRAMRNSAK
jgi:hypothetical protein